MKYCVSFNGNSISFDSADLDLWIKQLPGTTLNPFGSRRLGMVAPDGNEVAGRILGNNWYAVGTNKDREALKALSRLISHRKGNVKLFSNANDMDKWIEEISNGVARVSICVVGNSIPWSWQRRIALQGILVGRLSFQQISDYQSFADRTIERETLSNNLTSNRNTSKRIWVVAPGILDDDTFLKSSWEYLHGHIDDYFLEPKRKCAVEWLDGGESTADLVNIQKKGIPDIVLLLTHGYAAQDSSDAVWGRPAISAPIHNQILELCPHGITIVHLGCFGGGAIADDEHKTLSLNISSQIASQNRGRDSDNHVLLESTFPSVDRFNCFASECMSKGAGAAIAHVGPVWNVSFWKGKHFTDALSWLATGKGSFGYCTNTLFLSGCREGAIRDSIVHSDRAVKKHDPNLFRLRHYDICRFVLFGDPSGMQRIG